MGVSYQPGGSARPRGREEPARHGEPKGEANATRQRISDEASLGVESVYGLNTFMGEPLSHACTFSTEATKKCRSVAPVA